MQKEDLLNSLPAGFRHEIVQFKEEENGCTAVIRCNCSSETDFDKWMAEYQKSSLTSWTVRRTYAPEIRLRYRKDFICRLSDHRHVKSEGPRCLSRNCSASIIAKVKIDSRNTRNTDPYIKVGLCGIIEFNGVHSHPVENAHALSLLRPTEEVRSRFVQLFQHGCSVPEAIKEYIDEIELRYGDDEMIKAAANIVPPEKTVSYWFSRWRRENFGDHDGTEMWNVLDQKVAEYQANGAIVKVQRSPYAVVVITQIMQRAHCLPSASEIVFVDSTSSCDDGHHILTFLFAKCPIGAVPVGVLITNGSSEEDYRSGFALLKDAVGQQAFYGCGAPAVFMTDDSDAERNALGTVWPSSTRLLCLFHVAQAVWRWLRSVDNGINSLDRKILMKEFREVIYALTIEESEEKFRAAYFKSTIGQRYSNWLGYILNYWKRREVWCLAHRKQAALRGSHTNNYVEVAIRLFKDIVLSRTRAYNAIALVDFVVTVMERYYERRILQFSLSRDVRNYLLLDAVLKKSANLNEEDVIKLDDDFFSVKSDSAPGEFYYIDVAEGTCSCRAGTFGAFCKHQAALYRLKRIQLPSLPAFTGSDRHLMAILARGNSARPFEFYCGINEPPNSLANTHNSQQQQLENMEERLVDVANSIPDDNSASKGPYGTGNGGPSSLNGEDDFSEITPSNAENVEIDTLIDEVSESLRDALKRGRNDSSVIAGARVFLSRLNKIKTSSQLATSLHTFGSSTGISNRAGKVIRVQPTSTQRRRPCLTRGTLRLPGGQVSGQAPSKKRRRHNLASNVENNLPNGI